jgi:hypothetical protein
VTSPPIDYNPPECCDPPVTWHELYAMWSLLVELALIVLLVVYLVGVYRRRSR